MAGGRKHFYSKEYLERLYWEEGLSYSQISNLVKCPNIEYWFHRYGIPRRPRSSWRKQGFDRDLLYDLRHNQGLSLEQIAKRLGMKGSSMTYRFRILGIPTKGARSKLHPKLCRHSLLFLYQLQGLSDREIAELIGCPPSHILRCRRFYGIPAYSAPQITLPLRLHPVPETAETLAGKFDINQRLPLAYLLGAFLGDGNLDLYTKKHYCVRFAPGLSEEFRDRICACICKIGLHPNYYFSKNAWRGQWIVYFYSKALLVWLKPFKSAPELVKAHLSDPEERTQFLLGFIEAEGGHDKGNRGKTFGVTDKGLMNTVKDLLAGLGVYLEIWPQVYDKKKHPNWKPLYRSYLNKASIDVMEEVFQTRCQMP